MTKLKIENINVDKYRIASAKAYKFLQETEEIDNLTDAYIVVDLMKAGMEKANKELRKMKPTLNAIKQEMTRINKEMAE